MTTAQRPSRVSVTFLIIWLLFLAFSVYATVFHAFTVVLGNAVEALSTLTQGASP
jgi:uncharacterized membrane protein